MRQGRDDSEWPDFKCWLGYDCSFQRMNIDETGTTARGHAPGPGIHLAADETLPPVGGTVTMMTRTRTAHVGQTETTETGLPEAWTITLPQGTRMMIHDDGGTMESEMIG